METDALPWLAVGTPHTKRAIVTRQRFLAAATGARIPEPCVTFPSTRSERAQYWNTSSSDMAANRLQMRRRRADQAGLGLREATVTTLCPSPAGSRSSPARPSLQEPRVSSHAVPGLHGDGRLLLGVMYRLQLELCS